MRNFQQRMDEIHSRSKARIARRRKIAAACVPLVLCLVITGIYFIPYSTSATAEQTVPNAVHYEDSVTVYYDADSIRLTSAQEVVDIAQFIAGLEPAEAGPKVQSYISPGTLATLPEDMLLAAAESCFYFTITDAQGKMTSYRLTFHTLYCDESDIQYDLTLTQYEQLLRLLGIGEP